MITLAQVGCLPPPLPLIPMKTKCTTSHILNMLSLKEVD